EIMLQQTQVATVIGYFQRFVDAIPDLPALANAELDAVLTLWSGLGYYSRARNLHRAARICLAEHDGELPTNIESLQALPGIGRSTAGAILAQAHGQRFAILDGNVKRLLCRFHGVEGWPGLAAVQKQLWSLAERHLPESQLVDYTQAQMDLGATICRRSHANCGACPLASDCIACREDRVSLLPTRKPAKALPARETMMLLIEDDQGRLLLERRAPTGVWAGLWSLPEAQHQTDAERWVARHCVNARSLPAPERFSHVFSHFRLNIEPRRWAIGAAKSAIADDDSHRWIEPGALDTVGLPQPVRRLIRSLIPDSGPPGAIMRA
ncbi:MAG: A/G-specific adenine glycosylase, partial [Xanthomonadales bacterium]|nr:A/G-specific adenine glycosylase [Xanthomonadales bacterium]